MKATKLNIQQMIQTRLRKMDEITKAVEDGKVSWTEVLVYVTPVGCADGGREGQKKKTNSLFRAAEKKVQIENNQQPAF